MAAADATGRAAAPIFDDHHPPAAELYKKCVHCGFCLPTCPTYALWGEEMDSPRGRIYLMKLGAEGAANLTDTYVRHFDRCLGCMACVTACPSGVRYDRLLEATRAQLERHYRRSPGDALNRRWIFKLFPYPGRLRAALLPAWAYQVSGLRALARASGLVKLLPRKLRAAEALLPALTLRELRARLPERIPAQGVQRRRVGLLTGCVQRVLFSGVNAATVRVLAAEGCEVVIPRRQGCCGALMVHSGREEQALAFARRLIDVFERAAVDTIVINAAGCGSTMKEYGYLLRDDPRYAERAAAFAAKCQDVSEVLAALEPRAVRHPLSLRVAYHDACHLQHAQGVRSEPRRALATIPGLQLLEIPDAALCCGSAGIYNLVQSETAIELGDRKVSDCLSTGPDLVVSANPGCLMQLAAGLERAGRRVPVLHMIELMDAAISGAPAAELRARG
ncbi:MAG: glycolate oxidase subunit GlcF [Acidobacteria bacterium]|nr:glycolate oxidase subunit GlcF [Acidobacteriota bacterium]